MSLRLRCCLFTTQPRTRALACISIAFTCLRFSLLARLISATTSVPSTFDARMLASDKLSRGEVSKMITSAPQEASASRRRCIAFDSSNSDGFGGSGPEGMTQRFGISTAWTKGSRDILATPGELEGTSDVVGVCSC